MLRLRDAAKFEICDIIVTLFYPISEVCLNDSAPIEEQCYFNSTICSVIVFAYVLLFPLYVVYFFVLWYFSSGK